MVKMGVSHSTARWLAPASFLFDFAAQQYGMLSTPNMKAIHDSNLSFFSPQPFFIAGFFFPQQLFQLAWLYRLWKLDPDGGEVEKREVEQILGYVPYYAVGNVCIGVWMFFWNASELKVANIFVVVNTFTQLFYMIVKLPPMNKSSWSSILTHIVSKTFAGIGVLDLLHNTSAAYFVNDRPSTFVKAFTGVGFSVASAFSDWIFGACLVYDLVALAVGQSSIAGSGIWPILLGIYAVSSAIILSVKNVMRPPYDKREIRYEPVEEDSV